MNNFQYREFTRFSWWHLLLFVIVLALQGCSKAKETESKPEGLAVAISGYNYTIEGIQEFFVNGEWGGGLGIGAGFDKVCCVMLPEKWTPGLSATVEWDRTDCGFRKPDGKRCPFGDTTSWPHKKLRVDVPIEPYERPNALQVMFLPNDEVKIYVSHFGPQHPDHPGKLGYPHPIGHPEHPIHPDYKGGTAQDGNEKSASK